jgi:hypothetical protein
MDALHIVFRAGRFNLSKVGAHFVNPCCFGEDLAAWLRDRLREKGLETREPYQEDWGWELPVKNGEQSYFLCVSGNADGDPANRNEGEWRIIVEKERSIRKRLTGKGKITSDEEMLVWLREILISDTSIRDIHIEDV